MTTVNLTTAIYSRVSTERQDHGSQEREACLFADRNGWTNIEIYRDTISGKVQERPSLQRLLKDIREGKVERVVVYKMDRLGRSVQHLLHILQEWRNQKIPVYFSSQGISTDTANPLGTLVVNMLSCLAEFERDMIVSRVKAGLANRKAKGLPIGRRAKLTREDEAKVLGLYFEGRSSRQIEAESGVSRRNVLRIIHGKINSYAKPTPATGA